MAGNNQKKVTERRESSGYKQQLQQQRKNSTGGVGMKKDNFNTSPTLNKLFNPKAQQAAGAAILSAVNSPPSGFVQQQQHNGNGLNRDELIGFLNMRFSDALTAYHDTNLDPSMRPEKYEAVKPVQTSAWGKNSNGVPSAWSQPPQIKQNNNPNVGEPIGVMANGIDFLTELSKK